MSATLPQQSMWSAVWVNTASWQLPTGSTCYVRALLSLPLLCLCASLAHLSFSLLIYVIFPTVLKSSPRKTLFIINRNQKTLMIGYLGSCSSAWFTWPLILKFPLYALSYVLGFTYLTWNPLIHTSLFMYLTHSSRPTANAVFSAHPCHQKYNLSCF